MVLSTTRSKATLPVEWALIKLLAAMRRYSSSWEAPLLQGPQQGAV
jgi:hypothetical protein